MKRTTITPASPAPSCPFECTPVSKFLGKADVTPCPHAPTASGFCEQHQYAARLLELARSYGCPRLELEHLIIGRGLDSWEAYCTRVSKGHALVIETELKREHGVMFAQKGQVA